MKNIPKFTYGHILWCEKHPKINLWSYSLVWKTSKNLSMVIFSGVKSIPKFTYGHILWCEKHPNIYLGIFFYGVRKASQNVPRVIFSGVKKSQNLPRVIFSGVKTSQNLPRIIFSGVKKSQNLSMVIFSGVKSIPKFTHGHILYHGKCRKCCNNHYFQVCSRNTFSSACMTVITQPIQPGVCVCVCVCVCACVCVWLSVLVSCLLCLIFVQMYVY